MSKTEFAPPIPITDFCGFCGNKIPEKQIMTTGITCVDCKRPVCPSCKADVREAGLDGCPYCKTIHLDDDNKGVKQALKEIYNKKLIERKKKIEQQVSGKDDETPWMMTSHETGTPMMTNTSWSASSSSMPFVPGTPITQDDQYPYRPSAYPSQWEGKDPLAEPIEKPKKVTRLSDGEVLMRKKPKKGAFKPKITIETQVESGGNMDHVLTEEREVTPEEGASMEKSGTTFPIISRKVWRIANGRTFVKEKRWATEEEVTARIDKGFPAPEDLKEEAQRGTGRSTQRQLTALNHFFDITTGKYEAGRSVLFVVSNQRVLKETKRNITRLYADEYTRSNIQRNVRGTFDRVMDNIYFWNINERIKGMNPTLVVIDLFAPITYEQKQVLTFTIGNTPCVGLESVVAEEYKSAKVQPFKDPEWGTDRPAVVSTTKKLRSRKEKPPRTALRCFKCGHEPDECVCDDEVSLWQRFKDWLKRR